MLERSVIRLLGRWDQPEHWDAAILRTTYLSVVLQHISDQWKWVFPFLLLLNIANDHGKPRDTQQEEAVPTATEKLLYISNSSSWENSSSAHWDQLRQPRQMGAA